jgi:hypothetical protein
MKHDNPWRGVLQETFEAYACCPRRGVTLLRRLDGTWNRIIGNHIIMRAGDHIPGFFCRLMSLLALYRCPVRSSLQKGEDADEKSPGGCTAGSTVGRDSTRVNRAQSYERG